MRRLPLEDVMLGRHSWLVEVVRPYGYDHTQLDYTNVMSLSYFVQNVFTKLFISHSPKHIVSVFGAPFKVVEILAYAMASANKFHNLFAPGQVFTAPP